ncbi:hypothetical protein CapIbe_014374 [Capra ibex]
MFYIPPDLEILFVQTCTAFLTLNTPQESQTTLCLCRPRRKEYRRLPGSLQGYIRNFRMTSGLPPLGLALKTEQVGRKTTSETDKTKAATWRPRTGFAACVSVALPPFHPVNSSTGNNVEEKLQSHRTLLVVQWSGISLVKFFSVLCGQVCRSLPPGKEGRPDEPGNVGAGALPSLSAGEQKFLKRRSSQK